MDKPSCAIVVEASVQATTKKKTLNVNLFPAANLMNSQSYELCNSVDGNTFKLCATDDFEGLKTLVLSACNMNPTRYDVTFSITSLSGTTRVAIDVSNGGNQLGTFLRDYGPRIRMYALVVPSKTKRVQTSDPESSKLGQQKKKKAKVKVSGQKITLSDIGGNGKRICDSQVIKSSMITATSKESIKSVCGGRVGWEKIFKIAMQGAEQWTKAWARVNAVNEQDYSFSGESKEEGGWVVTNVDFTYGKVEGRRSRVHEEIVLMPNLYFEVVLIRIIESLGTEEIEEGYKLLTPFSISLACPGLYWSTVKEFEKVNGRKPKNINHVLINLFPNHKWEHLERGGRIRSPSAMAIENKRQRNGQALAKKPKRSSQPTVSSDDFERDMHLVWRNEFEKKVTKRASKQSPETFDQCQDKWQFEVPTEDDDDEIRLCVQASVKDEALVDSYSAILLNEKFLNWRQLAEAIPSKLQQRCELLCEERNISCPSLDAVNDWIVTAQRETMDEILKEIFTHVEEKKGIEVAREIISLLEKTNTDTPFDFVGVWAHLPPDQMLQLLGCDRTRHTENDARRWVSRAKRAIERHPWLKEFTMPIA